MVCRKDWSMRRARLVMKYAHEIGTVTIAEPNVANSSRSGTVGDSRFRSIIV